LDEKYAESFSEDEQSDQASAAEGEEN